MFFASLIYARTIYRLHTFRGVLQFRLPSAPQRYNTLDFPTENRVPTGMLLAPIGNPEPKELRPSGYPIIFSQMVPTCKSCVFPCPTIFRKCHSTYSPFLQELYKILKLCRDVTSKNSVFAHIEIPSSRCYGRDSNVLEIYCTQKRT